MHPSISPQEYQSTPKRNRNEDTAFLERRSLNVKVQTLASSFLPHFSPSWTGYWSQDSQQQIKVPNSVQDIHVRQYLIPKYSHHDVILYRIMLSIPVRIHHRKYGTTPEKQRLWSRDITTCVLFMTSPLASLFNSPRTSSFMPSRKLLSSPWGVLAFSAASARMCFLPSNLNFQIYNANNPHLSSVHNIKKKRKHGYTRWIDMLLHFAPCAYPQLRQTFDSNDWNSHLRGHCSK